MTSSDRKQPPGLDRMKPFIIAHRGAHIDRPENTLSALRRAIELGADGVECDVRTSRDGRLFILHDSTLDRTTGGAGRASDLTFDELRRLDAGGWFDSRYAGERIPSLEEAIDNARDRILLLLDLKETGRAYAEAIAAAIRDHGDPAGVILGVRSLEQAEEFRELIPQCRRLGFMQEPELIEEFAEGGTKILRLWKHWLEADPALAARIRKTGKELLVNGAGGAPEETGFLMRFAPDWILIDDVAELKRSLNR